MPENYSQKLNIANQIAWQEVSNDAKFKLLPQFKQSQEIELRANRYAKAMSLNQLQAKLKDLPNELSGKSSKKDGWDMMGLHLSPSEKKKASTRMHKMSENLHKQLANKPVPKESVSQLEKEITDAETAKKISKMSYEERKNYIASKFWDAKNKNDKEGMANTVFEFYSYECEFLDKKFGITKAKEFIKDKSGLNNLVDYINKAVDDGDNSKISKKELAWEIIKGVGDTFDSLIGTQGLTMGVALGAAGKIPKVGKVVAGGIQAYFAAQGTEMVADGVHNIAGAKTKDEVRQAGGELVMGAMMVSGAVKTAKIKLNSKSVKPEVETSPKTEDVEISTKEPATETASASKVKTENAHTPDIAVSKKVPQKASGHIIDATDKSVKHPKNKDLPQSIESVKVFDVKDIRALVPNEFTAEQLNALGKDMTIVKGKDSAGNEIKVLSNSAEKLIKSVARTLHDDAVKNKDGIEKTMNEYGFQVEGKFTGRSKKIQSLHDKIRTYIIEHPTETFTDAIRAVHDANGFRNVHFSTDVTKSETVQKYLKKGDIKSAQIAAAEIQAEPIVNAFKSVILDMAKGHPKLSITTISNYIGEDGIPYFSERQLDALEKFAIKNGVTIPIIRRAVAQEGRTNLSNPYAKKSTTKVRASGYSALQANFVTEKGDIFEYQFRGDKVNPFAEGEHVPYDLRNNKDIIGVNKVLEILYNPMKKLLSTENMTKERYKEYNAYLTAHYKYCRLVELGFEKPGNPPKLPEGFDARLRADNLATLHVIAEDLKDGKLTPEQAKARFDSELIRNNENNVTSHSYLEDLRTSRRNSRNISEYEANVRLVTSSHPESQAMLNACKDSKGNIKAILVKGVEYLRSRANVSDEMIIDFLNKNKAPDGTIDPHIYKRFCLSLAKK